MREINRQDVEEALRFALQAYSVTPNPQEECTRLEASTQHTFFRGAICGIEAVAGWLGMVDLTKTIADRKGVVEAAWQAEMDKEEEE